MREWLSRLWGSVTRSRRDRELEEELRTHLAFAEEHEHRHGGTRESALRAAHLKEGGVAQAMEALRDQRGLPWFDDVTRDLRHAVRGFQRTPALTAIVLLSLALGIGANTAIFSLINAVMMRSLPGVVEPQNLVRLTSGSFSYPKFQALQSHQVFAHTVALGQERSPVEINGSMQRTQLLLVSGNYFEALGVNAILGRTISPEDDRTQALVAVLSHAFWTRAFSADRNIVGKNIRVSGLPVTIIGVTAPDFTGVHVGIATELTMPVTAMPRLNPDRADILTRRSAHWLQLMGRLAPGQSIEQANARLQVIWPSVLAETAPAGTPASSAFFRHHTELLPAGNGFSALRSDYGSPLFALMGLVVLVLLIACANVANLMLARGASRQREFAIRLATGAGRGRLIRQVLTENILLATIAGLIGTAFAVWSTQVLVRFISSRTNPVVLDLRPDLRLLAFTTAVTFLTALLFGLIPALRAARVDVAPALKENARTFTRAGGRLRKMLVVLQVALSIVLAVGAGLFLNSFRQLLAVDTGFDAANVLLVRPNAIDAGHRGTQASLFFAELLTRVKSVPGVQAVAMSWAPPVSQGFGNNGPMAIAGRDPRPGEDRVVWSNFVSASYFATIGQKLLAGREFTAQDRQGAPRVAIVNDSTAKYFFGDESPIGRLIAPFGGSRAQPDYEIVGVVHDATHFDLREPPKRVVYVSYDQGPDFLRTQNMILEVRTASPAATATRVREIVAQLDKNVLVDIETLEAHVNSSMTRDRLLAWLSGFLSMVSLLLVGIGLYGVMAYSVTRRTNEIGVRLALGARPTAVLSMMLREGSLLVLMGVAIGVVAALPLSQLVATLLFSISAHDANAFAAAIGAMGLVTLLATILPALRAAQTNPTVALRVE